MEQVLILNFTGMYRPAFLPGAEVLDFRDLAGVRGFLDTASEKILMESLTARGPAGVHLIGDGNYHYVSRLFTSMIREPYDLLVFDHHTDLHPSGFGADLLTCGSWLGQVLLHDGFARTIYLAGPPERKLKETAGEMDVSRVHFLPEEKFSEEDSRREFLRRKKDLPLYLSVDEDILRKEDLITNWDQGTISLRELTGFLREMLAGVRLIGADICGGMAPEEGDALSEEAMRGREAADLAIIRTISI